MALLGAAGALLGAAGGEGLFLASLRAPVEPLPRALCLVFDLSESMQKRTAEGPSQLECLRRSALDFVAKPEFERDTLALVGFADDARVLCPPGRALEIRDALAGMHAGGATDIGRGLDLGRETLGATQPSDAWILLFTDGKPQTGRGPDAAELAREAARACRQRGIHLAAVGTGLADRALLEELTGDPASVFISAPASLGEAFQRSSEHIQSRQMLATTPADIDLEQSLVRTSCWAALVGFGAGLALVVGHNRHLRRRAIPRVSQLALVLAGATASGLAAGFAGQGTFYALSESAPFEPALRALAWVLLGSLVVLGMSFFVPNLPRGRALLGGALGGAAAVASFLRIVPELGDTPGRLLGAAILGFLAGAMTVLVEASVRKAWLVVHWPGNETSRLLLGPTPIVVGRSASAHICPSWDAKLEPVIGRFTHTEEGLRYVDERSKKARALRAGDKLTFGPIVVEVRAESGARPGSPVREPSPPQGTREASPRTSPKPALPRARTEHKTERSTPPRKNR